MEEKNFKFKLAIIGGGPSCLYVIKRIVKSAIRDWEVHVFEKGDQIGAGMPYSTKGANKEHVTNVSDNEVPELVTDIYEWINRQPEEVLQEFAIDLKHFHEYKVIPRLLFGRYLQDQFRYLSDAARKGGVNIVVHYKSNVIDIKDLKKEETVQVFLEDGGLFPFDRAIICTGHHWPEQEEVKVKGFFNSPYPPSKLKRILNHAVAIRGASLSAIDAIKTISRSNGHFEESEGRLVFVRASHAPEFKIILHSRNGMLPSFRFHLKQSSPSTRLLLTPEEIAASRKANNGFLSLDDVFEAKFKQPLRQHDPGFYEEIKDKSLEEFAHYMLDKRTDYDPFELFRLEYEEAEQSIRQRQSVYWKELLAELSYILNYPAKYLSAEDMIRLHKTLSPLISIIIAFVPQRSGLELLALHDAGVLSLKEVGEQSRVVASEKGGATYFYEDNGQGIYFETFIDCVGQRPFNIKDFPFHSLVTDEVVSQAKIRFSTLPSPEVREDEGNRIEQSAHGMYLEVAGIAINDHFQLIDKYGACSDRLFMMAVPFITGYNPDYSGLDFCEQASGRIVNFIQEQLSR